MLEKWTFPCVADDVFLNLSTETRAPWGHAESGSVGFYKQRGAWSQGIVRYWQHTPSPKQTDMIKEGMLICALQFVVEHFPDKNKIKLSFQKHLVHFPFSCMAGHKTNCCNTPSLKRKIDHGSFHLMLHVLVLILNFFLLLLHFSFLKPSAFC